MAELDGGIRFIKGIGEARAKQLARLGISTLRDLLNWFPRGYEDRTQTKLIADVSDGEAVCVLATVVSQPVVARIRRGMELLRFRISDGSGSVGVTFFNQVWIKDRIKCGEDYRFFGKFTAGQSALSLANPDFEPADGSGGVTGRIVPLYRLTSGISNKVLSNAVAQALEAVPDPFPDVIPEEVRRAHDLPHAGWSYSAIHLPPDADSLDRARRRFVFEELFVLAVAFGTMKRAGREAAGHVIAKPELSDFTATLPFELTGAQLRACGELFGDMASGHAMTRLLQGDVGSGKTAVAAACVWAVCGAGLQAAFMAPTEILAEQHLTTFRKLLEPFGINVVLLTGGMNAASKRAAKAALASGEAGLAIGTHAVISEDVEFKSLALVITDEQHRFGVRQRTALSEKGDRPHVLVMSATPIPRTLALIIYGDLDLSVLNELPKGRQKVDTFAVGEDYRPRINSFIRRLVGEGRQVFIVCPMIDEDEALGLVSVTEYAEKLRTQVFPELTVGLLHGRMKTAEKEAVMAGFVSGTTQVLVSTTVIEVGVDVPNAALMVIENAERFGLSQLHQLRGRVGRGSYKSYCILVNGGGFAENARLKVMCQTNDGFRIAEEDLKLRGPGDFFGSRQHGLPEMRIADLRGDMDTLNLAQKQAEELLGRDPSLSAPGHAELARRVAALNDSGIS